MYFDKVYFCNKKNLKPKKFANDKLYKEDDEFFADTINILDFNKPILELNIILCKSSEIYPTSNELYSLLSLLNISDLVKNKEY